MTTPALTPDQINGLFEAAGAMFVLNHVRRVWLDRAVAGVSLLSTAFFTGWGLWNLYYYPSLNQLYSYYGGVALVVANTLWIGAMAGVKLRSQKEFL